MMQSVALTDSVQQDDEYVLVQSPLNFGAAGTLDDEEENDADNDDDDDDGSYDYCDDAFSPLSEPEAFLVDQTFLPETIQDDFFGHLQSKQRIVQGPDCDNNVKILLEGMRISSSVILSESTEQRPVSTDLHNQPLVTIGNQPGGPGWFSSSPLSAKLPLHTEVCPFASTDETSTRSTCRETRILMLYQGTQEQLDNTPPHGQHSQDEDLHLIKQANVIANPFQNHVMASSDKILDAQQESSFATTTPAAEESPLLALPLPLSVALALQNNTATQEPSSSSEEEADDSDYKEAEREESSSCNNETELDPDSDDMSERDDSSVAVATTRSTLSRAGEELSGDDDNDEPESSCATTTVAIISTASRLPNKKRRKQMKQAKKAASAVMTKQTGYYQTQPNNLSLDSQQLLVHNNNHPADATSYKAALLAADKPIVTANTALSSSAKSLASSSSSSTTSSSASSPFGKKLLLAKKKKTSKKQVANIAVACATQAFDCYQQEVVQKNSSKKTLRWRSLTATTMLQAIATVARKITSWTTTWDCGISFTFRFLSGS